jgi:hypothetical protein
VGGGGGSDGNRAPRSHSIFTIKLERRKQDGDTIRTLRSKINLVDLAGLSTARPVA